jgi:hypothetical protein
MQHDVDNLLVSVHETMTFYKGANLIFSSQFSDMCSVVHLTVQLCSGILFVVRYLYVFISSGYKIYAILYTQKYRQLYIQHLPFLKFKTNEFLLRIMQTQYNNSI